MSLKELRKLAGVALQRPSRDEIIFESLADELQRLTESEPENLAAQVVAATKAAMAKSALAVHGTGDLPAGHKSLHRDAHHAWKKAIDAHGVARDEAEPGSPAFQHHSSMMDAGSKLMVMHGRHAGETDVSTMPEAPDDSE